MNQTMIGNLPLAALLCSLFGAVLIALGALAAFGNMDLVPVDMRLPAHPWSLLGLGLLADLPLVAWVLRRAAAMPAKR